MKASITRTADLIRFERAKPSRAVAGRWSVTIALCTLALLAASPANAQAQGSLVSWGDDYYGQVTDTPAGNFSAVAVGRVHSVAIRTDGTLVSWGANEFYHLGVPAGPYIAVAAGDFHNVAIHADGTLVAWGPSNDHNGEISGTPAGTFIAVAAGSRHSVALRTDGSLVSWGYNNQAQVSGTPAGTYTAVAAGDLHSVALRTDGTLVSWGYDYYGQVGGTPAGDEYTDIAAGGYHSIALRTDGTLVSWGDNDYGQVSGTPAGTFIAVAGGNSFSVAVRTDGTLVSWGYDGGFGMVVDTPAGVFSAVAAGSYNSVAIMPRPVAISGPNQSVDCTSPAGATVILNGSASFDADGVDDLDYEWSVAEDSGVVLANPDQAITSGVFPVGVHQVTLTVYDIDEFGVRKGGVDVASVTITVVDDDPPVALVTTDIASLSPANGKMIPVTIFVQASDTCSDPNDLAILCNVSSNQLDVTNGSVNRTGDVDGYDGYSATVAVTLQNVGDGLYSALIYLRAERDSSANTGRIYSIGLSVMDGAGNIGNATTTVVVPHDGKKK